MTSERLRLIDQPGLQSQPVMNTCRQRVMSREKSNRSSATKTLTSGKWGLQAQSSDKLAQPRPLSSELPMPRRWMSSSRGTGRGSHQSKQRTTAPRVPTVGTLGSQAMRKSCSSSPYTKKKYIYIYRYNIHTYHSTTMTWTSGCPVLPFEPPSWGHLPSHRGECGDPKHHPNPWPLGDTDGRNPANQLRLVVYPIIYRVFYIPGGAGRKEK